MTVIDDLREAGVPAEMRRARGAGNVELLAVSLNARTVRFAVVRRRRAPYPSEFPQLESVRPALRAFGPPLLMAPSISAPMRHMLTTNGWSWADERGSYDIRHDNVILRQTVAAGLARSRPRAGIPQGRGSLAMVRYLLSGQASSKGVTATALGKLARASQAAASQLLAALNKSGAVARKGRSAWMAKREQLLDQFLASYAGPRGAEQYFYSLESPYESVGALVSLAGRAKAKALVSADLGPDSLAPWRVPTIAIVYTSLSLDLSSLKIVAAHDRGDANIIVRVPHDSSIFDATGLGLDAKVPLTDIPQMLWDLHDLGGSDREEAADKLRQWFLNR